MLGLDLLHGDEEVGFAAGHVGTVVVGGELQREGLGLAHLHAAHGLVELLQHLAFADQELEGFGLAAVERLAVDLAFEVDRDAVAGGGALGGRALGERAALLAQDVHGLVDGGVVDAGGDALHFGGREVADDHFGIDLEGGVEFHRAFGRLFLLGDARRAGDAELGLVRGGVERVAQLVVHHLVLHLVAIALRHDRHRNLARAEPVGLDGAGQLLEAGLDFLVDLVGREAQRDAAFELVEGFYVNCHDGTLGSQILVRGAGLEPARR